MIVRDLCLSTPARAQVDIHRPTYKRAAKLADPVTTFAAWRPVPGQKVTLTIIVPKNCLIPTAPQPTGRPRWSVDYVDVGILYSSVMVLHPLHPPPVRLWATLTCNAAYKVSNIQLRWPLLSALPTTGPVRVQHATFQRAA